MNRKLLALPLMLCLFALNAWSQSGVKLEVFNPPTSGNGYQDLFTNILDQSHVNGIAVFLQWGSIDNGCQSSTSGCAGTPPGTYPQTGTCLEPDCYWSLIDSELLNYINGPNNNGLAKYGQKLNLIIDIIPEAGSKGGFVNNVPTYVFDPTTYSNGWCPSCNVNAPQDQASCKGWPGDASAPTCGTVGSGKSECSSYSDGVWNRNACRLTGGGTCPNTMGSDSDQSGYPVLYETPFMTAYALFVQRTLKHYSSVGSGNGSVIGPHIGYIRIGLAEGGENLPTCTLNGSNVGIWPSPAGLATAPDWYQTSPSCSTGAGCRGKDAYIAGVNNPPGYVKSVFAFVQQSLQAWISSYPNTQIMANTHMGPPSNSDVSYADEEAPIFAGYKNTSGFGMEALSEYDVHFGPSGCTDDWCANFNTYYNDGNNLNLYLQTATPNGQTNYGIASISVNGTTATATCTTICTPSGTSGQKNGLYQGEPIKITGDHNPLILGGGTDGYFLVKDNSDTSGKIFTFDISTGCTNTTCTAGTGGTLFIGDFLPDTIPFAVTNHANTLELYYCDWEYAFSPNSVADGCPAADSYQTNYQSVLNNP